MSVLVKVLIFAGAILAFGALGLIIYNQINISKQQTAIQQQVIQQKTLVDGLVQSSNRYTTTADLNSFIQQNTNDLKAIQANLSSLGAKISGANVVTVNSGGQNATGISSTSSGGTTNPTPEAGTTVACPNGGSVNCPINDPFGYQQKEQTLAVNETFGTLQVPFSNVSFSAWEKAPWSVSTYPRQYSVVSVIGTNSDTGRLYVDNKVTVAVNGKNYTLPVSTAATEQITTPVTFSFWNPRLLLGIDGSLNLTSGKGEFAPNVSIGIMSLGQVRTNPDWSFLEIGAAYQTVNKTPAVMLTPVAYNIGKKLFSPLMTNTYIGPSVMLSTNGSWSIGGGLKVGF
jgi:hypothetical protein